MLELLDAFVAGRAKDQAIERGEVRFSRRELRESTAIGDTQLRLHLDRLAGLEYLFAHRGARGSSFVYELVYDGEGRDGKPFVAGLIDVELLRAAVKTATTTANLAGVNDQFAGQTGEFAGSTRGQRGPNAGGSRPDENAPSPRAESDSGESSAKAPKTHIKGGNGKDPSYPQEAVVPLAAASRDEE